MHKLDLSPVYYGRWLRRVFGAPPFLREASTECYEEADSGGELRRDVDFSVSDPVRLIAHFTRMCREFLVVSEHFTLPQIDRGLWALLGTEIEFGNYLIDEGIPLALRLDCVRAMEVPFRDFVARCEVKELENCFYMWWDLLAGTFWSTYTWRLKGDELMETVFGSEDEKSPINEPNLERLNAIQISIDDLNADGRAILDAMLETLLAIAQLDDDRTVYFALHGLGHLRHPEGSAWIQSFIDARGHEWGEDGLQWLEQCRDGTVM